MQTQTDEPQRLPELIRTIGADVTLLFRQEADLARQEMKEIAARKAMGGALLGAAAICALFVIGFLGLTGAAALDLVLPRWAALLIVGGVYLVLGAIAALVGRTALAKSATPERTKQRVKEEVEWAKRRLQR